MSTAISGQATVCVPRRGPGVLAAPTLALPSVPSNANTVFDETLFTDGFSIRDRSRVTVYNASDRYLAERLGKTVRAIRADGFGGSVDGACPLGGDTETEEATMSGTAGGTVNVNPPVPCAGLNVYTMNALNKPSLRTVPYRRVIVLPTGSRNPELFADALQTQQRNDDYGVRGRVILPPGQLLSATAESATGETVEQQQQQQPLPTAETRPVAHEEHRPNAVYTVNGDLTPFEMAVMIKYYAVNDTRHEQQQQQQQSQVFVTDHLYHTIAPYFADQRKWFDRSTGGAAKLPDYTIRNGLCELIRNGTLLNVPELSISGEAVTI